MEFYSIAYYIYIHKTSYTCSKRPMKKVEQVDHTWKLLVIVDLLGLR